MRGGELLPVGALDDAAPDDQWLNEATGNKSITVERVYRRAALVSIAGVWHALPGSWRTVSSNEVNQGRKVDSIRFRDEDRCRDRFWRWSKKSREVRRVARVIAALGRDSDEMRASRSFRVWVASSAPVHAGDGRDMRGLSRNSPEAECSTVSVTAHIALPRRLRPRGQEPPRAGWRCAVRDGGSA